MKIWIDAQLSPSLASWISKNFSIEVRAVRDVGLREAKDRKIFDEARKAKAIVMTKDSDFLTFLDRHGVPPQILWVTCGNTSTDYMKIVLTKTFPKAMELLTNGEPLVEISGIETRA